MADDLVVVIAYDICRSLKARHDRKLVRDILYDPVKILLRLRPCHPLIEYTF